MSKFLLSILIFLFSFNVFASKCNHHDHQEVRYIKNKKPLDPVLQETLRNQDLWQNFMHNHSDWFVGLAFIRLVTFIHCLSTNRCIIHWNKAIEINIWQCSWWAKVCCLFTTISGKNCLASWLKSSRWFCTKEDQGKGSIFWKEITCRCCFHGHRIVDIISWKSCGADYRLG